jgi:recombination protein RecA
LYGFLYQSIERKGGVMFGNPETTTGGTHWFYASVRLDIRRSTQIKMGTFEAHEKKHKNL